MRGLSGRTNNREERRKKEKRWTARETRADDVQGKTEEASLVELAMEKETEKERSGAAGDEVQLLLEVAAADPMKVS